MDRFFDRLGDVLKSYLNSEGEQLSQTLKKPRPSGDPDLDAAYEELDDFLSSGKKTNQDRRFDERLNQETEQKTGGGYRWSDAGSQSQARPAASPPGIPESLRPDFAELGVAFGADATVCKDAYKKLVKIHHPDRHAGHEGNMKKATEKSARINAAYQRIDGWRKTGRVS